MTEDIVNEQPWDVIIVGGGAAGLNAALVLARARRRVIVVDAGAPRNRFAAHMHGFLTRDGMSPLELLELGRAEVLGYGATILSGRAVTATGEAGAFEVTVEPAGDPDATTPIRETGTPAITATRTLRARRLLIATGLRDELPAIPGLAEQWGTGAVACPYCDGWESRDKRIGVLTTSPMSAHQATLVRQWSADITVIGTAVTDFAPEIRAGLEARGTRVIPTPVAEVLSDTEGTLTGVALADGTTVPLDTLFVGSRLTPNDDLLHQLGAATTDTPMGPWTASDPTGLTSVPGLYVAGNSATAHLLVIAAAASGLTAATVINADLVTTETQEAVAAHSLSPKSA
ncbi:NAD(P)/FAD-dependent oxidoreductase [Herbiconiux sp.]|uniref:NAD(P)/FAD-dependent oxidoreductase n=1 Tax=Herbiconiux sp. TaxID=1871186 RepID=UPI0025C26EF8|nr:NAD(P)/FAD-dependent oxidoreductase [Herbiconiux sp.]